MTIIHESFHRLFPRKPFPYQTHLEYNRRLSDFNAHLRLHNNTLSLHLNLQWKDIDEEIKIGLIQSLLLKVFKERKNIPTTPNLELYNNFIRNIPLLTPKTRSDPILENSFQRAHKLFQQFFDNQLEQPNLQWGEAAFRRLAHYNFHDDSITVSSLFKEVPPELLDYLMYHELLHKFYKFEQRNGRSAYHTREFKEAERKYPRYNEVEQKINSLVRKQRRRKMWSQLNFFSALSKY